MENSLNPCSSIVEQWILSQGAGSIPAMGRLQLSDVFRFSSDSLQTNLENVSEKPNYKVSVHGVGLDSNLNGHDLWFMLWNMKLGDLR